MIIQRYHLPVPKSGKTDPCSCRLPSSYPLINWFRHVLRVSYVSWENSFHVATSSNKLSLRPALAIFALRTQATKPQGLKFSASHKTEQTKHLLSRKEPFGTRNTKTMVRTSHKIKVKLRPCVELPSRCRRAFLMQR